MPAATGKSIDQDLALYASHARRGVFPLLVNLINEIERLELTIAQQCESLESAQLALSDIELSTMDEIYSETIPGAKRGRGAKYPNEHQRRVEMRARLRSNSTYNSLRDSQRGMVREKARLTARLHRLEAFRQMLLADLGQC